ncbi:rhamnogalacturonan lyase [Glycomyces sp. NPDC046736]|uniref:rhamnogalacturonan lyase n=1 Tax=Glycomyces sp. NPDC046736 TaxID=3155615 RepID=UPI0033FBD44C
MRPPNLFRRSVAVSLVGVLAGAGVTVGAQAHGDHGRDDSIQLERLDRGLVAAVVDGGVFLSWRLLADEVTGYNDSGLTGATFQVYRDGKRIATVTDSTNFQDESGNERSKYKVVVEKRGKDDVSATVTPWSEAYLDIPLQRPADGVTPAGEAYTYAANDISPGDLDGDGDYEYVVKWDPSNSKDVSQVGYTGPVYLDAYTQEGDLLWRIDLGVNIRAGAHYTQFDVYDFDGDGKAEVMLKTAPGTKTTSYAKGGKTKHITLPKDDKRAGVTHADDYRLSAEGYYDHLVDIFQGWDSHPEVAAGNWPATIEAALGAEDLFDFDYPLSQDDAETLADHFIDVYAPSRSANNRLRSFEGFIVDGPEYLTVFEGKTGKELQTIDFPVERGDDGLLWGDYAMSRIEPGNRVDRFLSGVAYLDGEHPSAIFARGYYTRTTITAIDWDGRNLTERWQADSGHAPMSNPFNDGPHGVEGPDPEWGTLTTQGNHSLSVADVDGDGRQEIVYGAATLDDDGSLLYSSYATLPEGSADPGATAKLGHGDALHLGDLDPNHEGLEIFSVFEGGTWAPYGYAMRDAATGEVLWGGYSGRDTGRGMVGDVDPSIPGLEAWASLPPNEAGEPEGLFSAAGEPIEGPTPGTNASIRWAGDLTTQMINGTATDVLQTPTIDDRERGTLLTAEGTLTNNWTKGNPGLVADVLGDWREELLVRTADSSAIRVYLSTEVTDHKLFTLMHDPQYRVGVANQQTTYNMPQYPSFYLGSDMDFGDVTVPDFHTPGRGRH